ncbi:hypothetical protein [Stomatohabitans albus]|uniref:tetratricopeptide repeat protein n=1 Tax=Stomatohabitans albus TaxID=3110766 RepID=UPI00300CC2A6
MSEDRNKHEHGSSERDSGKNAGSRRQDGRRLAPSSRNQSNRRGDQRTNRGRNDRSGGYRGGRDRDDNQRHDRGYHGKRDGDQRNRSKSGDSRSDRGGYRGTRDEARGPRRDRDDQRGGYRGGRDRDRQPRRDGDHREGGYPRRDGEFRGRRDDSRRPRRNEGGQRRDGDRFSRGPRRDGERDTNRQSDARQGRHRSGGQFRRRDIREAPIQRSLTGSPVPVRTTKTVVEDVARPWFPEKDDWPEVPRRLLMEIEKTARESEIKEVAVAVMIGTEAFEQGDLDRALEFFTWAKSRAARSITIREGLGICYYVAGQFEAAQRELQAYARISGRVDHNHIIADSSRATGNGDRVPELIDQMIGAWERDPFAVDLMNLIEGLIVLAGYWLEDRQEPERALAAITKVALPEDADVTESHLRLWHVQARAAEAAGDHRMAAAALHEINAVNPEWLLAMNKWIAGEDVSELLQPWATEIDIPEELLPTDAPDIAEEPDSNGDDAPLSNANEQDTQADDAVGAAPEHLDDEQPVHDVHDDGWDPGDDWEDEDWEEEDPEPGIPIEATRDTTVMPHALSSEDAGPAASMLADTPDLDQQPSLFDDES